MKTKCLYPFTFLEFQAKGDVFCCCPAWTKLGPVGNLFYDPIEKIWNSEKIQLIRKRVYENNLRSICKTDYCPFAKSNTFFRLKKLASNPIYKDLAKELKEKKLKLTSLPTEISIADSDVCNLQCIMCRSGIGKKEDKKLTKLIFKETLPKLLPHLRQIKLTGNGEPFIRKTVIDFLSNFNPEKYPNLSFYILTNGLLLDQKMWKKIKHNNIDLISVSIDAAQKNTYQKIRRGGNWERLQKNLKMLSRLKKMKKFKNFSISMAVMKSNYKEMVNFIKMGKSLDCTSIRFRRIYGLKALDENINLLDNPQILTEIKEILKNPVFSKKEVNLEEIKDYQSFQPSAQQTAIFKLKSAFLIPLYKFFSKPS